MFFDRIRVGGFIVVWQCSQVFPICTAVQDQSNWLSECCADSQLIQISTSVLFSSMTKHPPFNRFKFSSYLTNYGTLLTVSYSPHIHTYMYKLLYNYTYTYRHVICRFWHGIREASTKKNQNETCTKNKKWKRLGRG